MTLLYIIKAQKIRFWDAKSDRTPLFMSVFSNAFYPSIHLDALISTSLAVIATARAVRTLDAGYAPSHRVDTQTGRAACEFEF